MRVLVTGSRHHTRESMRDALLEDLERIEAPEGKDLTIIHGGAPGADEIAGEVADEWGANVYRFPAEWDYCASMGQRRMAGPLRNAEMLKTMKPDFVLAYPLPDSKGTWDMVTKAQRAEVDIFVHNMTVMP